MLNSSLQLANGCSTNILRLQGTVKAAEVSGTFCLITAPSAQSLWMFCEKINFPKNIPSLIQYLL